MGTLFPGRGLEQSGSIRRTENSSSDPLGLPEKSSLNQQKNSLLSKVKGGNMFREDTENRIHRLEEQIHYDKQTIMLLEQHIREYQDKIIELGILLEEGKRLDTDNSRRQGVHPTP